MLKPHSNLAKNNPDIFRIPEKKVFSWAFPAILAGRGFALSRDLKVARPFSHISRVRTLRASTPNAQVQDCAQVQGCHRKRSAAI
jgi:hypothetical protein